MISAELSSSALFLGSVVAIGLVIPIALYAITSWASPLAMLLSRPSCTPGQPAMDADELPEFPCWYVL